VSLEAPVGYTRAKLVATAYRPQNIGDRLMSERLGAPRSPSKAAIRFGDPPVMRLGDGLQAVSELPTCSPDIAFDGSNRLPVLVP
jgi:hypothetical protein